MDHLAYIGQTISDYHLLRWLGGGGFGNVYLAQQEGAGLLVAVKVLQIRLSEPDDFRAFITEARTMRLRHPHIVPLLDFGLGRDNTPFLVMEYAPKGTLRDRHPKGSQIPLLTAVEYADQVASALHYAHNARLVHRDVKPANMLVRSDGTILLSDFGIATAAHSTYSQSANQGMVGTVPYMSPEQLAGKPRAASDQYALAVVLYEWLTGNVPFQGTAIEVAMQHATQPPPSLVAQVPHIPQEVEAVLFKALAKDYKDRFLSMREFITALRHVSIPSTSRPSAFTGPVRATFEEVAPPPISLPLAASKIAATPPVSSSPSRSQTPPVTPSMPQTSTRQPTESMIETASAKYMKPLVPEAASQKHVAKAPINVLDPLPARKHGISKKWGMILILLSLLLVVGGSYAYATVSNEHIRAATASATASAKAASDAYNLAVAQKGVMFGFDAAHTRANPYERILNSANVSQLQQAWTASTDNSIDSSPAIANGVVYVGSADSKLYAFDASNGRQLWTTPTSAPIHSSPAIANGVVYVGSYDGKFYAFDASNGHPKWTAPTGNTDSSPAIANGVVYVGSADGKLYAFDASNGHPKWTAPTGNVIGSSPAIANGVVYVGSEDHQLYAFNASNGLQLWTASAGARIFSSPAIANGVVYIGSYDHQLYAFNASNGLQLWTAPTGDIIGSSPAIANGVVYIGSYDHQLYAFNASNGLQLWTAYAGASISSSPAIANGVVYVGSESKYDNLYAFSLPKNTA